MNVSQLASVLSGIGRPRIVVAGEAILDEYVWGEVERISPEAPIPVLRVTRREVRVGGAGSVVLNLLRLGAQVSFLSAVGDDAPGRRILEILRSHGADVSGVITLPSRRTIAKARHLGYVQHANRAVQQLLRVDDEETCPFEAPVARDLLDRYRTAAAGCDAVLVSDYRKGLLTSELLQGICAGRGRAPVLVDPGRIADYTIYRGAFLICPNRYETSLASGMPVQTVEESGPAAEKLIRTCGFDCVAVTLDRDGVFLQRANGTGEHFPTAATVVADVTGAGDMVLSVLGLVIGSGGSVEDAVRLSNVAAGIEIRQLGVVTVSREEILSDLRFQGHLGAGKLKSRAEAAKWVKEERAKGKRIVFTNGCFDLLHYGHHILLSQARKQGDRLIVAVNADSSVQRLKGPGRPFNNQDERMLMLSSLESVDCVVLFDEDTPIPLLELLRPDVLVKGGEYEKGVVVGRELVESYGGRVALVDQVPGISTTGILELKKKGD